MSWECGCGCACGVWVWVAFESVGARCTIDWKSALILWSLWCCVAFSTTRLLPDGGFHIRILRWSQLRVRVPASTGFHHTLFGQRSFCKWNLSKTDRSTLLLHLRQSKSLILTAEKSKQILFPSDGNLHSLVTLTAKSKLLFWTMLSLIIKSYTTFFYLTH